jgi:uncharacterized membrane protein
MTTTTSSPSVLRLGVIVLALTTAIIHLYLGSSFGDPVFVLNGLGYLALFAALYLPISQLAQYRNTA